MATVKGKAGVIVSSNTGDFYCALNNETPFLIAKKCNVHLPTLLSTNAPHHLEIRAHSKLYEGTVLRLPDLLPGTLTDEGIYVSQQGETITAIAERFSCSIDHIVNQNRSRFPKICAKSKLWEGTHVYVPGLCKLFCRAVRYTAELLE